MTGPISNRATQWPRCRVSCFCPPTPSFPKARSSSWRLRRRVRNPMRMHRAETLERLHREHVDLLVIGAGIVGARIAFEAARSGLNTVLLDAGDFGGATSSSSSKLVHG